MPSQPIALLFILSYAIILPWLIWRYTYVRFIVPCAVVQIAIGIALGPTFLGRIAPDISDVILSPQIRLQVDGISMIAILFFALITGMHIDLHSFRGRYRNFLIIGISSVAVPFCMAVGAAKWIWQTLPSAVGVYAGQPVFIFAIAIALSVTALPVLGAILSELKLLQTPLGQWSLGLAAINDAALWILVSTLLAGIGSSSGEGHNGIIGVFMAIIYIGFMYGVVRRLLVYWFTNLEPLPSTEAILVGVTAFTLVSAFATELLGLHYLLGAFIAGTILPQNVKAKVSDRLENATILILAPFFFTATGLKVNIDFSSQTFFILFFLTTAIAIIGKYFGASVTAKILGFGWRESFALGSIMQAKGMMELAVLTILVEAGLISNSMFSAMTLMALACTAIAMPLTRLLAYPKAYYVFEQSKMYQ